MRVELLLCPTHRIMFVISLFQRLQFFLWDWIACDLEENARFFRFFARNTQKHHLRGVFLCSFEGLPG